MLSAFLAGANLVMHTGGWLEGGLVASFEKLVIDLEIVRTLRAEFTQIEVDEASLAFDAHLEVGHGGHFLGAAHTLERFRTCFYRPLVSTTENFERWTRNGAKDTAMRASELVARLLADYEQPALHDGVRTGIDEYVDRRRRELGD
jgi:trimethylamine--corrinoid protein Co-methyltransferase